MVRKKQGDDWGDHHNAILCIGCYCFDVYFAIIHVLDTAAYNDPGKYINHAIRNYKPVKMQLAMVGEPPKPKQLKMGFLAWIDIKMGKNYF